MVTCALCERPEQSSKNIKVRAISREVRQMSYIDETPQRLHARHPPERWRMVIQSELPGNWKPGKPGTWLKEVAIIMNTKEIREYKKNLKLIREQREILIGILLGDAHLETRDKGRTYRLKIEQSFAHKEYVDHLYEKFRGWVLTPPQARSVQTNGVLSNNYRFQTLSHGAFRFYGQQFYKDNRKHVPLLIHRWLTERSIAYWFMDDGSLKSKESKGIIFNTQAYSYSDVNRLIECLKDRYALDAWTRKQKDGIQIYISGRSYERFCEIIRPNLIDAMYYKLPLPRKTR